MKTYLILLTLLLTVGQNCFSQKLAVHTPMAASGHTMNYFLRSSKESDIRLSGTSTLHKWDMNAHKFDGSGLFEFSPQNSKVLVAVKAMSFALMVRNLKSDNTKMDDNAYDALKEKQFAEIYYTLQSAQVLPKTEGKYLLKTNGELTIAGVTKNVSMDVLAVVSVDGSITCTGAYKLNMSDYQVKPPSYMLGAMKVGDALTLEYTLAFQK